MDDSLAPDEERRPPSDLELILSTRRGSTEAYAELWSRHKDAALSFALTLASLAPAEDLVSEAFTKILTAIQAGKGPTSAFRPYVVSVIRNTAMRWSRQSRNESLTDAMDTLPGLESVEDAAVSGEDQTTAARAFRSLPQRWQEALWYSEVEQLPREAVAELLGIGPNAVSALTYRAREALRTAWLQAQVESEVLPPRCRPTAHLLGGYTRRSLGRRDTRRVEAHLESCDACRSIVGELRDTDSLVPRVAALALLGVAGAAAYQAFLANPAPASAATPAPPVSSPPRGFSPSPVVAASVAAAVVVLAVGGGAFAAAVSGMRPPAASPAAVAAASPHASSSETPDLLAQPAPSESAAVVAPNPAQTSVPHASAPESAPFVRAPSKAPAPVHAPRSPKPRPTPTPHPSPTGSGTVALAAPTGVLDTDPKRVLLPQARGRGIPGARVEILDDDQVVTSVVVGAAGEWTLPQIDTGAGSCVLTMRQRHGAHVSSEVRLGPVSIMEPVLSSARVSPVDAVIEVPDGYELLVDGDVHSGTFTLHVDDPSQMPSSVIGRLTADGRTSVLFATPIPPSPI